MLPIVAALIKMGLPIIAGAVVSKGKDVIESKLGINLDDALGTEEGRFKLRQAEIDHEEFLITSAIESDKLSFADTANARDTNAKIQESEHASWMAKNVAYCLDILIVASTIVLGWMLFFVDLAPNNRDLAFAAFGSMMTLCGTVVNFHRGTSSSSAKKNDVMELMAKQGDSK
jgi:hypothetical protein